MARGGPSPEGAGCAFLLGPYMAQRAEVAPGGPHGVDAAAGRGSTWHPQGQSAEGPSDCGGHSELLMV